MTYVRLAAGLGVLLATPAFAAVENADQPAAQQSPSSAERDALLREIEALRARVEALEAKEASAPPPTAVAPNAASPVAKLAKDHNLELYGFLQLDAIQDFKRVNPDWDATLRPSRIPTMEGEFGGDGQSIFSVRQSRLGVKANGTLYDKPYEAKFEFDLYGTGDDAGQTTFRVRHMYASWGPFLIGQTNTLFMDGDIFPNVVDYWGPTGMVFVRNPQIRWTFLNKNGWTAAVALEHPSDDIDPGNIRLIDEDIADNIQGNEELPDLTAAIRYGGDWGHVRLAGLLRRIGYDTRGTEDNEPDGEETGWGINATSAILFKPIALRLGVVYGRGIATYMNDGGMDLAPSVNVTEFPGQIIVDPEAEAVKLLGVSAYADINWTPNWTSAIGYSFTKVDNTNFQEAEAFHKGEYASANLLYQRDNILTGLEFLWGQRTDNDGDKGDDLRLQGTFKWSFSSKNIWDWVE